MKSQLQQTGYALWAAPVRSEARQQLRDSIFRPGKAGSRCLLDIPVVLSSARAIGLSLIDAGILAPAAVAIQAIAFDKSPDANWKVTWHQDLMFPFNTVVRSEGYEFATVKEGVDFARPPQLVLEELLAVRLHLDDCDDGNGPLRVAPGTHRI